MLFRQMLRGVFRRQKEKPLRSSNCVILSLCCPSESQQLNAQFSSDVLLPRLPACSALKHEFCSANPDLLSSFIRGSLFNSNIATQKYKEVNGWRGMQIDFLA